MYVLDPLHDYAVVQALPDVMQRIASTNPDTALPAIGEKPTGRIILPDTTASEGLAADNGARGRGQAVTTLLVGRVLWVGPGKHREGLFIEPTIERGDLVLFMPRTVSYEFALHGRRHIKIVPYHELVSAVREVSEQSREWQDFLALLEQAVGELAPTAPVETQLPATEAV